MRRPNGSATRWHCCLSLRAPTRTTAPRLQHRQDTAQDDSRVLGHLVDEGAEVELRFVTGEVGQGADLEPRQAETLGDLGECAALRRDRPAAELAVQALTRGLAVDELVARQNRADKEIFIMIDDAEYDELSERQPTTLKGRGLACRLPDPERTRLLAPL
jgi:hypothetical protein